MIIFGTRGLTLSGNKGQFHCPRCGEGHDYIHRKVRRFFTLYFIPLIPLNLMGEYIECQTCKSTWEMDVLAYDPNAQQDEIVAEFEKAILKVMLLVMLADGVIDHEEIDQIVSIYNSISGQEIQPEEVRRQATALQASGATVESTMKEVTPTLNEDGKEMVIKAAFFVALADGDFQDNEQAMLLEIADAMSMSKAHFNGILHELTEG